MYLYRWSYPVTLGELFRACPPRICCKVYIDPIMFPFWGDCRLSRVDIHHRCYPGKLGKPANLPLSWYLIRGCNRVILVKSCDACRPRTIQCLDILNPVTLNTSVAFTLLNPLRTGKSVRIKTPNF